MITLLITVVTASILGSLHCVGMCGCFVAFYAGGDSSTGWRRMVGHGVYSLGRLLSYLILGVAAGGIGAALDLAGTLTGFQRSAALIAGVAMIVWGVLALLRAQNLLKWRQKSTPAGPFARLVKSSFSMVGGQPPVIRAAAVGLLSGILPCGWLWAFVVAAAGTGSALKGGLVMAAFWAGTVPALVGLGVGAQWLAAPLRRHLPSITAVIVVSLGIMAVVMRPTQATAMIGRHHPVSIEDSVSEIDNAAETPPPCCSGE